MKKQPSREVLNAFTEVAKSMGAKSFTVTMPYICDHCKREDEEAFPYHCEDAEGHMWEDLCNDCFEALGCEVPDEGEPYDPYMFGFE